MSRCKGCGLLLPADCTRTKCVARVDVWDKLPAIHRLMMACNQNARTEMLTRARDAIRQAARASRAPGTT